MCGIFASSFLSLSSSFKPSEKKPYVNWVLGLSFISLLLWFYHLICRQMDCTAMHTLAVQFPIFLFAMVYIYFMMHFIRFSVCFESENEREIFSINSFIWIFFLRSASFCMKRVRGGKTALKELSLIYFLSFFVPHLFGVKVCFIHHIYSSLRTIHLAVLLVFVSFPRVPFFITGKWLFIPDFWQFSRIFFHLWSIRWRFHVTHCFALRWLHLTEHFSSRQFVMCWHRRFGVTIVEPGARRRKKRVVPLK